MSNDSRYSDGGVAKINIAQLDRRKTLDIGGAP